MSSPPPPPPESPPPYGSQSPAEQVEPRPGELLNRFLARLIDHVLLGVVFAVFYGVIGAIVYSGFRTSFGEQAVFYLLTSVLTAVAYLGYFTLMESHSGQTIGKMVLKLKTFGPDGESNPTLEQAIKRNLYAGLGILGVIPFIGWFLLGWAAPLIAMIAIAVTLNADVPKHQGWHDKFAGGTQVMQIG